MEREGRVLSAATRLAEWRDHLAQLERQQADWHLLRAEERGALLYELERARRKVRFFEAELELETTQAEINAFKREVV